MTKESDPHTARNAIKPPTNAGKREQRRAAALRENLKRRKEASRETQPKPAQNPGTGRHKQD